MAKVKATFKVGDKVSTKVKTEALYSGFYKGTSSEYPEQYFEPGMIGEVVAVDSPAMRRNINQYVVNFHGKPSPRGKRDGNTLWTVRLDPDHVINPKELTTDTIKLCHFEMI